MDVKGEVMKKILNTALKKIKSTNLFGLKGTSMKTFPSGHYYSPIPNMEEIENLFLAQKKNGNEIIDIDINKEIHFKLLEEYQDFYRNSNFPEKKDPTYRYYYNQDWFGYTDAFFLYSFLRKHTPKKIIEVGSGFSSAVMLDTIERYFPQYPQVNFIEPNPARLMSLLRNYDKDKIEIFISKVQDVPIELFTSLGPNDLLFIDSSHVVKCGNDLHHILFNIIPKLSLNVFVHFHDIFYPFEYSYEWLKRGRYWNEAYFLRAFLANNKEWEIYFFNSYAKFFFKEYIEEKMPMCKKFPGGSIYLQKTRKY